MIRFLDLSMPNALERSAHLAAIETVLTHGQLVMGPEVEELESAIARECGREYAVAVGSGTDALYLALRALDLGPGDEVITTPLSWIATANAIRLTGARAVFADIDEDLNIDPESIEPLVNNQTRAIVAVDYTGRPCDFDALETLAQDHGLYLVEDASQAFGAEFRGRRCGSLGDISAISHNPMKVLSALGEAGSITTDSSELRERLIALRYNGTINREICIEPSINGRMDTVQAAVLLHRLTKLSSTIEARRTNARYYNGTLGGHVRTPTEVEGLNEVFYTYTIRTKRRDQLAAHLAEQEIETKIQHPLLMPQQPAYEGSRGSWARASEIVREVLCIPVHEGLSEMDRERVAKTILDFNHTQSN